MAPECIMTRRADLLRLHGHAPFGALIRGVWRATLRMGGGWRFHLGLLLLLVNVPFGYGALAFCGAMAVARASHAWALAGGICYGVSWLMLGAGTLLVGLQAKKVLSHDAKRKFRAWKRFNSPGPENAGPAD